MSKKNSDELKTKNQKSNTNFQSELDGFTEEQLNSLRTFLIQIADITIETYFNNDETNKESSADEQSK